MTTLTFTGNLRTAALHILDSTPLGGALARLGAVADSGTRLTIADDEDWHYGGTFSHGEEQLLAFLTSLAGRAPLYLRECLDAIDRDCQTAVLFAVAAACDITITLEQVPA